jgi:beta-galactosidase
LHGADYNPTQWPESVWDDDVRLMNEAHVNVATVAVFDWVHLQPAADTYTFDWLDKIMDKLHADGVHVCLATATAAQPDWMDHQYPDVLPVDSHGIKRKHGARQNICPNSPSFRRFQTELVRRMADRYKNHPALTVWHISNEYVTQCYCDNCARKFRVWLKQRYGTLAEVNRRWNAAFWGHTFTSWDYIDPPSHLGERNMQGLTVDYDRFQSESMLNCYRAERDILKAATPDIPITTNLMGACKPTDYFKWAKELDIVSWDNYPYYGQPPASVAFSHALMRGVKDGKPFMLMEQTPSQQNWQAYNSLKRPGIMRLWSYQAMAHGADTIMYFQWRRSQGGIEKLHGAIVEHEGSSKPRVFQEVAALGRELESLGDRTLGGRVPAKVAVLFDWENWWAVEYSAGPTRDLKYADQVRDYYIALHTLGIPTEIVTSESDFSRFDIVIAPVLYMVKPGVAEKLEAFTAAGGTFLTTFFSGIVDETDLVHLGGYPGPLRKLTGVWAEEIDALPPDRTNDIAFDKTFGDLKGTYTGRLLFDIIHAETAEVLATYKTDFYAGQPALTVNQFGKGKAYYVATCLGQDALVPLVAKLCADKSIASPVPGVPAGVEISARVSPSGEQLIYLLNHATESTTVTLPSGSYRDLLSGKQLSGSVDMAQYDVLILAPA